MEKNTMTEEERMRLAQMNPVGSTQIPQTTPSPSLTKTDYTVNPRAYADPLAGSSGGTASDDSGSWFNKDTLGAISGGLGALGSLAQGWAALKGIGVAEDDLKFKKDAFEKNFGMQQAAYNSQVLQANNRIGDQNAWKRAQGRTDLANLVPAA